LKINPITSPANPVLKKVRSLHQRAGRQKAGAFLIEGAKRINEALDKGIKLSDVIVSESYLKEGLGDSHAADLSEIYVVDDRQFKELVTTDTPCRILAAAPTLDYPLESVISKNSLVVVADAIQDPGNLGTIMRTALAAGASGMIFTKGTVDPYNSKVVRSAAGALFSLPFVTDITAEEAFIFLKELGARIITCEPTADKPYWECDLSGPVAVAFGNEGQGFTSDILALSDESVSIPMNPESESLNVAVSAGIILFSAVQQRRLARAR
jgi:RNA methyltransferase, TrmH family